MLFRPTSIILFLIAIFGQTGFAYESEEQPFGYVDSSVETESIKIHHSLPSDTLDENRIQKFEAALDALGIPLETAPDFSNFIHANEANENEVRQNASLIDPNSALFRYLSLGNGNISLFRDFFSSMIHPDYLEYQQTLSTDRASMDSPELMKRLSEVSAQVRSNQSTPLSGLKVLIDPGHMGGDEWDQNTGKYVEVKGKKVSEGMLTLWTSLVLADKLEKLGAIVLLTREQVGTVSHEKFPEFNATPFIHSYFHNSLDDWMAPYLEKPIDILRTTIPNAPEVLKAYSGAQKMKFYITGADLEARSQMMDSFKPDLSIVIHFDASRNDQLQSSSQSLEAFIPGAFGKNETGSRKSKALGLKHLLEVRRWNQTVELADAVTRSMSQSLNIPRLNIPQAFSGIRVRDGVYTRNLYLNRRSLNGLLVYLECLHYDHVLEHPRLSVLDQEGTFRGTIFRYPSRLKEIAQGIESGVLEYFQNFQLSH